MNGQESHQTSDGPYYNVSKTSQTGDKRKSEDDGPPESDKKTKRNRYISIACNECKRRKIKCNGQNPCQRCGNLSLECVYAPNCACSAGFKDSPEFRAMSAHIQSLQEQVNNLYANLDTLRNGQGYIAQPNHAQETFPLHPALAQSDSSGPYRNASSPSQTHGSQPRFQGPTSSAFSFDVARSSLQTMGITAPEMHEDGVFNDDEMTPRGSPRQLQAPIASMTVHPNKDPLWKIGKDEAIRLCRVYEEEMGIMYPIIDMERTITQANTLFTFTEAAARTGLMNRAMSGPDRLANNEVNILKMVLAIALIVEGEGQSDLGRMLYESCREAFEGRLSGPVEIKGLILLVLVAEYHFQQDEEVQAYRIIGLASRLCLEIGLHRRQTIAKIFPNDEDRSWATKLFWSIYVLDRRWSFGTGMPFAVQDADIDPHLSQPDDSTPYLTAMIAYSRISSQVWRSTTKFEGLGNEINKDNIGYLDFQILQWHNNIPESLRFHQVDNAMNTNVTSRGQRRLQVILVLRTNQMRVLIYRPVLHSATNIMENRSYAQTVVDVAKDTIRVLTRLNETTDIYRTQQVCFNYFLISALAVLFLAVAHAPVEFSRQVRDEFYMALDLIKGFSTKSYISKRLWKMIKGLKEVGPKLGVISRQALADPDDAQSSAAVAMAGLAGHPVDQMAAFTPAQQPSSLGSSPLDGQQMKDELTNLFEAAGGYGNNLFASGQAMDGVSGFVGSQGEMVPTTGGISGVYGNEGEFSRIMENLFSC